LILPLLAWNLVLGRVSSKTPLPADAHSPKWLLMAENVVRVLVCCAAGIDAIAGRAQWQSPHLQAGLIVYVLGTLVTLPAGCRLCLARLPPGATARPDCWRRA